MSRLKLITPSIDRNGKKFYSWTLIEPVKVKRYVSKSEKNYGHKTVVWYYKCQCDCGNISIVGWPDISTGKSKRCKECHLNEYILNSQEGIKRFGKENSNYRGSKDVPGKWLSRARNNAKIRNIEFNLTLEDLQNQWEKQKGLCTYSGVPLVFAKNSIIRDTANHISMIASLDRIDSSKEYCPDNITWVSKTINLLKMDLPHTHFLKLCEMVYLYNKNRN